MYVITMMMMMTCEETRSAICLYQAQEKKTQKPSQSLLCNFIQTFSFSFPPLLFVLFQFQFHFDNNHIHNDTCNKYGIIVSFLFSSKYKQSSSSSSSQSCNSVWSNLIKFFGGVCFGVQQTNNYSIFCIWYMSKSKEFSNPISHILWGTYNKKHEDRNEIGIKGSEECDVDVCVCIYYGRKEFIY